MATDRRGGSVGSQKPVPSWLNSAAWSHSPSSVGTKKANTFGSNVVKGFNEPEKANAPPQSTAREEAQVHPPVQEGPLVREQGRPSLGSRSGSLNSSVLDWPSSDATTTTSSPGSVVTPLLSQSPSLSKADRTLTGSATLDARIELFTIELSRKRIHLAELQRMSGQGIPDYGSLRSMTWKLLLGYMPRSREEWAAELSKKRAEYATFKEELLVNPSEVARRKEACQDETSSIGGGDDIHDDGGVLRRHDITHDDHPLSIGSSSIWHQYFQDTELSEQIDRDVKRTHPDIQFFCGESSYALENQEALKRALFIFAKLNPGIRYVQGMNEVLAPLYYVFRTDPDEEYSVHAEADAFFCFVELLSDFRDNFCHQLDNSAVGVRATLNQLNALLRRCDEELWRHLELIAKVNPQFYAFRWITLLLTQEFNFPDCLRLWDSFLSNPDGPLEILLRVCCAMLLCVRSRLLAGDFTTNLKLLQNYPAVNIHHLLGVADDLRG